MNSNSFAKLLAKPFVRDWIIAKAQKNHYHHIRREDGTAYMYRYWFFNPVVNGKAKYPFLPSIRLHVIMRPDRDPHLHDHPWDARTYILDGWYVEHRLIEGGAHCPILRATGTTASIGANDFHKISHVSPGGCYTLFIMGKKKNSWGFMVDGVKVHWKRYLGIE